jgi:hypothetical protein
MTNVMRAADVERRHGFVVRKKLWRGQPHECSGLKDSRPVVLGRKPSGGQQTLEAERTE